MKLFILLTKSFNHKHFRLIRVFLFPIVALILSGCDSRPDISLPEQDHLNRLYPIGFHKSNTDGVKHFIISRYSGNPIIFYLPDGDDPHPVVLFQHGRPFKMPTHKSYYPNDEFVSSTLRQNIALAVVIRSGYYGSTKTDNEKIPCNNPKYSDFESAAQSASNDINAALSYLKELSFINSNHITLVGTSAGGFASIASLPLLDYQVNSVISINGGRCGKRGRAIGGLKNMQKLYTQIGSETVAPVYFLAGSNDEVIPAYSTEKLYKSFCKARSDCSSKKSVHLIKRYSGNHNIASMLDSYEQVLKTRK